MLHYTKHEDEVMAYNFSIKYWPKASGQEHCEKARVDMLGDCLDAMGLEMGWDWQQWKEKNGS